MTDPSTPVPSDDTIRAAVKAAMVANGSENRDLPVTTRGRIVAAVEAAAPILRAEAAAEARAATLRDMTGDEALNVATAAFENRIGTTHGVGDGMRAALAALCAHFNPEANDA